MSNIFDRVLAKPAKAAKAAKPTHKGKTVAQCPSCGRKHLVTEAVAHKWDQGKGMCTRCKEQASIYKGVRASHKGGGWLGCFAPPAHCSARACEHSFDACAGVPTGRISPGHIATFHRSSPTPPSDDLQQDHAFRRTQIEGIHEGIVNDLAILPATGRAE